MIPPEFKVMDPRAREYISVWYPVRNMPDDVKAMLVAMKLLDETGRPGFWYEAGWHDVAEVLNERFAPWKVSSVHLDNGVPGVRMSGWELPPESRPPGSTVSSHTKDVPPKW